MEPYLVSIIVPIYNSEIYLSDCIDSIIGQTYKNLEIILVNDGSTDKSGMICDAYVKKDERITVIHKKNEGVTMARIDGTTFAKGSFIHFVDSDDYISPNCIEILVKNQKKIDADVVVGQICKGAYGNFKTIPFTILGDFDHKGIEILFKTSLYYDSETDLEGLSFGPVAKLYRRNYVIEGLKEGIGFWYGEDMLMNIHILQRIEKLTIIPNVIYFYVVHDGQTTKKNCYEQWDAFCKLARKLWEIDKIGQGQQKLRVWKMSQHYCSLALNQTKGINELTRFTRYVFDSELVRENIFNNDKITEIIQGKKSRLKYFLLKNRLYRLYSIMVTCIYKLNNNDN